jgi:hypothetical protein
MKNWIWVLTIPLVGFLGYVVLNQSNGENKASFKGPFGVEASFARKVDPNGNPQSGNASMTYWTCYHYDQPLKTIGIWWGHEIKDAVWACNNWISECGNGGGCQANKISK